MLFEVFLDFVVCSLRLLNYIVLLNNCYRLLRLYDILLLLSDILGTDSDITHRNMDEEVDKELLHIAMSHLSKREKTIMELRFGIGSDGDEKTQKQVADMLGISQSYISRLEKKIVKTF